MKQYNNYDRKVDNFLKVVNFKTSQNLLQIHCSALHFYCKNIAIFIAFKIITN